MKFQAVAVPNRMIAHLDGPYRTPQNNAGVLSQSGLLELMREHAIQPGSVEGDPPERRYFQLYGDSTYGVSPVLVSPHARVGQLTDAERAWNTGMGGGLDLCRACIRDCAPGVAIYALLLEAPDPQHCMWPLVSCFSPPHQCTQLLCA